MIGEIGVVKGPIGSGSPGWAFVHGEWWRATTAIAPKDDVCQQRCGQVIGMGRRVLVVGLQDGKVAVVPF
jgi:membrane-bound ClpP family serine protease